MVTGDASPSVGRSQRRCETRTTFFARLQGKLSAKEYQRATFAYDLAKYAHLTQFRKGARRERYFEHPRASAIIAIDELGITDAAIICALLLHDVIEDSFLFGSWRLPHAERWHVARWRITTIFGATVASMVLSMSKPSIDHLAVHTETDVDQCYRATLRRASSRTLVAKMCDRLHNLRSMRGIRRAKQREWAHETRTIYFPIFRRAARKYPRETAYLLEAMERELIAKHL